MLTAPEIADLIHRREWTELEDRLEDALRDATGIARLHYLFSLSICYYEQGRIEAARGRMNEIFGLAVNIRPLLTRPILVDLAVHCEKYGRVRQAVSALGWIDGTEKTDVDLNMNLRLRMALENATANKRLTIVPLGQNCIPGDLLKRWGHGRHVVDGPFNSGIYRGDSPLLAIEGDFKAFRDFENLQLSNTAGGVLSATLPKYRIFFNHETGPFWLERECRRLRNLYAARIARFREAVGGGKVLFVFTRSSKVNLEHVWDVVKNISPSPESRLLVLDFLKTEDAPSLTKDPRVTIINTAFPDYQPKYTWYISPCFNSPAGFQWEKGLMQQIQPVIEAMAE